MHLQMQPYLLRDEYIENMIPKVIHYCWFGGKKEPASVKKCIQSWKKYCPEYKIIRWDENNFDVFCNDYCKEAYLAKKWAFVSDYARLKIIFENGGIYLDTDVELINSLDPVLDSDYFLAEQRMHNVLTKEEEIQVATGLGFGAVKGNAVIEALLKPFEGIHFTKNGEMDLTPCPDRNTRVMEDYGFIKVNQLQKLAGGIIYPSDYFCPREYKSKTTNFSENTISIHHYSETWISPYLRIKTDVINAVKRFVIKLERNGRIQ